MTLSRMIRAHEYLRATGPVHLAAAPSAHQHAIRALIRHGEARHLGDGRVVVRMYGVPYREAV